MKRQIQIAECQDEFHRADFPIKIGLNFGGCGRHRIANIDKINPSARKAKII